MTEAERRSALEAIAAEVRGCVACRLHRGRTNAVPGEGSPDTEVVFVGEGPGYNEDQQGRPFVGAAGGLLDELLAFIRWRRDDVFIANVVKCRPPGNRDPEPDEIAACAPYLRRQLEALDPAVVVTLGRHSLGTFAPGTRIANAHGTARSIDPGTGASRAVLYAMYHPAAAFRQTALRETLFADMANLPQVLIDARLTRQAPPVAGDARTGAAGLPDDGAGPPGDGGRVPPAAGSDPRGPGTVTPLAPPDAEAADAADALASMDPSPGDEEPPSDPGADQMILFTT